MNYRLIQMSLATAAMLGLVACSGSQNNNELQDLSDQDNDTAVVVSAEVVGDMIQNVSSPVEMANEIKNTGVAFSQNTLNEAGKENSYETSFKKAVNLGVYSADLGYINTFGKNLVVVDYLSSIKRLADGLGVGQFLDFQMLSRMAKDNTNLDSLKQLSVTSFNNIDKYLRDQKRSNVSTAIVVGTWVEGIYITCQVIKQTNDEGLINRLGEQKNIVDILEIVINAYSNTDYDFKTLSNKVTELKRIYDNVKITMEMGEPITKEVDGMLVIEQNEITHVDIKPETVSAITSKIDEIRDFLVK
ncbi:MAG: hypothetical protein ACI35U_04765 [Marinilabiliaceae bacterium]|nr:hypothetical protein [Bacteroidales bacterium]MDD5815146.1 hypothetical protein [Bacteroidales bacterium]MDY4519789.1 hypothetical protein [Bacteroidales bacterium]